MKSDTPEGATHKIIISKTLKPENQKTDYYKYIENDLYCFNTLSKGWYRSFKANQGRLDLIEIKQENIYTQEMHESGVNPEIGSRVIYSLGKYSICENKEYKLTKVGQEMTVVAILNDGLLCLATDDYAFSDIVNSQHIKPIDTRTDREKAIDDVAHTLKANGHEDSVLAICIINSLVDIEALTFTENKND